MSQRDAFDNIWLMNADGSNQRLLIASDSLYGGVEPRWSPDGTRIMYSNGGEFRIVSIDGHTVAGPFRGSHCAWGPAKP